MYLAHASVLRTVEWQLGRRLLDASQNRREDVPEVVGDSSGKQPETLRALCREKFALQRETTPLRANA